MHNVASKFMPDYSHSHVIMDKVINKSFSLCPMTNSVIIYDCTLYSRTKYITYEGMQFVFDFSNMQPTDRKCSGLHCVFVPST